MDIMDQNKFEVKEDLKERQIKEYVRENPEAAVDLIKAWLKE
jgi:flagellar biosynthesis/type III secretory pathway M-ring protein FliF/YscJ